MSQETVSYGYKTSGAHNRLFLKIPMVAGVEIDKYNSELRDEINRLRSKHVRLIDLDLNEEAMTIFVNTRKIGVQGGEMDRRRAAGSVVRLLGVTADFALSCGFENDPRLTLDVSKPPARDGRLWLEAQVKWPEGISDGALADTTTRFMQDTARKLKYDVRNLNEEVGALVDRAGGVSLIAHALASSSIETAGDTYRSVADVFVLEQHNIYNSIQQLILMSGAVALANADELLQGVATE